MDLVTQLLAEQRYQQLRAEGDGYRREMQCVPERRSQRRWRWPTLAQKLLQRWA